VKVPLAMGGKYVSLVFVFSASTGELLAIFPDASHRRVESGLPMRSARNTSSGPTPPS
jgi:hypothetical protein